jgi:hypothetical protein
VRQQTTNQLIVRQVVSSQVRILIVSTAHLNFADISSLDPFLQVAKSTDSDIWSGITNTKIRILANFVKVNLAPGVNNWRFGCIHSKGNTNVEFGNTSIRLHIGSESKGPSKWFQAGREKSFIQKYQQSGIPSPSMSHGSSPPVKT